MVVGKDPVRISKRPVGIGSGDRQSRLRAKMGEEMATDTLRRMLTAKGGTVPEGETRKK
jgi:hypothetical protein